MYSPDGFWDAELTTRERKLLRFLNSAARIQEFLDGLPYRPGETYLSPLSVLRRGEAHCFDGAIFGCAALRQLGHPPKLLYLIAEKDDDHMLALYRRGRCWGAVSKSNFATMGLREPVYRTLRELVMSYFDFYFNVRGYKSLRAYAGPLSLQQFDRLRWTIRDEALEAISTRLDWLRPVPLISRTQKKQLALVGSRAYRAGLIDANKRGLYKP
jgi:hypothetical protein